MATTHRRAIQLQMLVRGACRTEDPDLFFPIGTTGPALRQIEDAKAVCRRCEVADACLDWALRTGQDAGVWGGRSEEERRTLRLGHEKGLARG
jgi:WhiB family transcriptional regulator, redox-sensing transcriptional regulator